MKYNMSESANNCFGVACISVLQVEAETGPGFIEHGAMLKWMHQNNGFVQNGQKAFASSHLQRVEIRVRNQRKRRNALVISLVT